MLSDRVIGRRQRTVFGLIGLVVTALMLAACQSSSSGSPTSSGSGGGGAGGASATANQTATDMSLAITPSASGGDIDVTTPIVVKATGGTVESVTVTNSKSGVTVTGTTSSDGSTWTSNQPLGYGNTYTVAAVGQDSSGRTMQQSSSLTTLTPSGQANPNMVPSPSSVASTGIGVGQPIVFQFGKSVAKSQRALVQSKLVVTSSAGDKCSWYWISASEVHCRGQNFWTANQTLTVTANIYGVDFGGGIYGSENRTVTYKVHDALIAKADGNTSQMQLYDNGNLINTMPISMGKQSTPTHVGIHVISNKQQTVQMNSCTYGVCPPNPLAYNETEYWAERMSNDGEFVHENPDTVGQQGHANVSHGCINLSEANAEWFFNKFGIGDVVEVANSGGPPLPIYDTYGDWAVSWSTWSAGNA